MKRALSFICVLLMLTPLMRFSCYAKSQEKHKLIALTFDDGPHPRQTKQILEVLDKYDIKATFFVIGINVKNYPGIVEQVIQHGHEIGNHTYTHSHAAKLDADAFEQQILDCEREIFMQTGKSPVLFRPPEGAISVQMKGIVHDLGYVNVLWSLDTLDWAHTPPESISAKIVENATHGDIILMHDYIGANSPTVQALEIFIPQLLDMGFTFVTVSELLEYK